MSTTTMQHEPSSARSQRESSSRPSVSADSLATSGFPAVSGSTLRWSAYLATSWTWCIGMFLPVLLMRDLGVWAFVVFAVPNVLGAALMGRVLSRIDAQSIQTFHRPAVIAFSAITIAFQAFFLVWAAQWAGLPLVWLGVLAVVLPVCFGVLDTRQTRTEHTPGWTPLIVWGLSLVVIVQGVLVGAWSGPSSTSSLGSAAFSIDLLPLLMVCLLGFACSPYLDATFLRTRASLGQPAAGRTFALGLGFMFTLMILGTLWYAPAVLGPAMGQRVASLSVLVLIALHIVPQLLMTISMHRACARDTNSRRQTPGFVPIAVAVGALCGVLCAVAADQAMFRGLLASEAMYRVFMGFYGLVAPAYVLTCLRPGSGYQHVRPSTLQLSVFAAAVILALPFYFLGFVDRQWAYLVPGVVIVLVAAISIPAAPITRRALA
ncbi:MAG: hypothetical protein ACK5WB_00785 [Phycisphaerales bacterium]|jgi:hypothetical protein|nr:hypothetical protein [Phycisphaeraceae bacterium]